jgi:hypothetical protein
MEPINELSDQLQKSKRPELPSNYFDELTSSMMEHAKQYPKAKKIALYRKPLFWIGSSAASLLLIIGINSIWNTTTELSFDTLNQEEVLAYVEENIDDFDEELFIEVMNETLVESDTTKKVKSKTSATNSKSKETVSFETLTSEEILEYLNENELSIEELEETIEQ